MPYKFENQHLKLNEKQDRRIKLTSSQKENIKEEYATGVFSLNDLAKKYNVSKKTILLIVNPESKKKNDDYIKNNWEKFYNKDYHNKAIQKTRKYKQELYNNNKLI